jgi:D-alanine--D-alanine ligase
MKIAVVTNAKNAPVQRYDTHAKEQAETTCLAVTNSLKALGHEVTVIEAGPNLLAELIDTKPDAVFNIATGYRSKRDQANIVAVLELSGVLFTGSSLHAHTIGLHKHLAKMLMSVSGVRTPGFLVVHDKASVPTADSLADMRLPVIVKPAAEGSSVGITSESVTSDPSEVARLALHLMKEYGPPVLVEEFISGREFTVGVLGYPEPKALPVEEIIFNEAGMYTYSVKSRDNVKPVCPADIPSDLQEEVSQLAERAFVAIGCRDLGRVDLRLSEDGVPYVIEINTLPGLMPSYSEFPRIAEKAGISYTELIRRILDGALQRGKVDI